MAKITFITRDGASTVVEGSSGSVMELAVNNNILGIDGDCGGVCSCATCHVHLTPEDMERIGNPSEIEADMLELEDNVSEYSRLSCQLKVGDALDGVVLTVATS